MVHVYCINIGPNFVRLTAHHSVVLSLMHGSPGESVLLQRCKEIVFKCQSFYSYNSEIELLFHDGMKFLNYFRKSHLKSVHSAHIRRAALFMDLSDISNIQ